MTRKELLLARIATVLNELAGVEYIPESHIMLALDLSLEDYYTLKISMVSAGLITEKFHALYITSKGKEIGERCNDILKKAKEAQSELQ